MSRTATAAALALVLLAAAAARARAQDETATSVAELESLAAHLASPDAGERARAEAGLRGLDEATLPAVAARLERLHGRRPPPEQLIVALARFRQAAGGTDAITDRTDIARGIATVLATHREPSTVAAAESVLLLRALEHVGTPDAVRLVPEVVALDGWPWDPEVRCLTDRLGAKLLPVLLVDRVAHTSSAVRRWARRVVPPLFGDEPGRAIQDKEPVWLAALLRAYGQLRDMHAMRIIVSYVGSEHALVRDAARWATARYGRNAIWALRDAYSVAKGEDPSPQWGSERTFRALVAFYDDQHLADVRVDLDAGLAAYRRGDLATMEHHFDAVLARAPLLPQRAQLTDGYAALGARRLAEGDLDGAERALTRALSVAGDDGARRPLTAQLAFVSAERSLAAGVVDEVAYGRVLALSPADGGARARLELLRGEHASKKALRRRVAAGLGALLLLGLAVAFARRKRTESDEPRAGEARGSLVDDAF